MKIKESNSIEIEVVSGGPAVILEGDQLIVRYNGEEWKGTIDRRGADVIAEFLETQIDNEIIK